MWYSKQINGVLRCYIQTKSSMFANFQRAHLALMHYFDNPKRLMCNAEVE